MTIKIAIFILTLSLRNFNLFKGIATK